MRALLHPAPNGHDSVGRLLIRILGRSTSLFAGDVDAHRRDLVSAISGRRLLVAGGAGSIGSAFVKEFIRFAPRSVHVVDPDENALVELVRDLRSSGQAAPDDFRTFSVAIGSPEFGALLAAGERYDHFMNFAALKHVRAERDVFSLMRMIDVNVCALASVLRQVAPSGIARVFSVSSDKAVNPANLMGATKALMENVLFAFSGHATATTARFANVAFSAGSLLEGFLMRLAKHQPLAGPSDVRRYFISHEEAGQLCLLAAFLGLPGEVFVPKLDRDQDLKSFSDIAVAFLDEFGFKPRLCQSEAEALASRPEGGHWPCYFAPASTTGEKPYEEFVAADEHADFGRFSAIGVIKAQGMNPAVLEAFLAEMARLRAEPSWRKEAIVAAIHRAVPSLAHQELGRDLDRHI